MNLLAVKHQHTTEGAWLLYISFQNYNTQGVTGKFVYKPSIFDEKQLHLKQERSRSHKSAVYSRTEITLQHVLLLTKTKGSYAHVLIIAAWLLDESSCINCAVCELIKPVPSDSRSNCKRLIRRLDSFHSETLLE